MKSLSQAEADLVVGKLKEVFPSKDVTGVSIRRFDDGISNENFLVEYADGEKLAFRLVGPGGAGMVDRMDEKYNTMIGVRLGITPKVLYFDEKEGVKATQFIADAETLHNDTIKDKTNVVKITEVLRTLHRSKFRLHKDFNVFTEVYRYEALLDKARGKMYDGYAEVRETVLGLEGELNRLGTDVVACHCDTLPENWLKDPTGKIWLLDWEYSGMNDPYWDITAPFIEAGFTSEQEKFFLNSYFDGSVPPDAERKVLIYKIMMDYLWSIWARVKELDGADLREYGLMRLHRGIENIKKL